MSTPAPAHPGTAYPDTALAVLFGPGQDTPAAIAQRLRSADLGTDLGRVLDRVPPLTRDAAIRQVSATATELLDVNLADVVAAGWRQHEDLTGAARRTLAAPGSTELVELASHRLTAHQDPYVSVLVDGHQVGTVRFRITLGFSVSPLLAEVRQGRLAAVHSGRCQVTATLAVQDITVVSEQGQLDLPGMVTLRHGIRLLPAHEYPAPEYPADSYPAHGYPAHGYPADGYSARGYPADGHLARGDPAGDQPPSAGWTARQPFGE